MLLARPELTRTIAQAALSHRLTVVVAPMGYGKTTLARALIEELPKKNSFYYAVATAPHDGHFFWHDMWSSLEAQGLAIAPAMRRLGLPETASQMRQATETLRAVGSPDAPFCLIIDDYHFASAPLLNALGNQIFRENVPNVHYILLSRTRPAMMVAELSLKGHAALFEQDVLTFSQEEAVAFFQANGVEDRNAALEAHRYSEGWPAALWLCLQSWQKHGKIATSAASGDIDPLLANTVFAAYSQDERDFLLRLSVFESFRENDAEKIAATAGWLPVSLMELRQKNAFLSFDPQTECYQFHSIFRNFLRKRLVATGHIDKPSLYRFAAECCFERNDLVNAFRLFSKAGRDEDLLRLLDTFWHFAEDRTLFYFAEECFRAAGAVPWSLRLQNPLGWLAFVALHTLLWKGAVSLLDETEARFRAAKEIPEPMKRRLQGEVELVRAFLNFNDTDALLLHYSEAVRLLNGPSHFADKDLPWNCSFPNLSFGAVGEPGRYKTIPERGAELLHLYNILAGGKVQDGEDLCRGEYLLDQGDFPAAERVFADTFHSCHHDDRRQLCTLIAAFGLARVFTVNGDAVNALSIVANVRPRLEALDLVEMLDAADVAQGYVAAVLGKLSAIPQWLCNGEMFDPPHNVMPFIFGISFTIHGKALLLQGEYSRLATVAREIPDAAPLTYLLARIHGAALRP